MNVIIELKGKILQETYQQSKGYTLYSRAKQEGMPFSGMIKIKFLKVCRIKPIKCIKLFLFDFRKIFKKE